VVTQITTNEKNASKRIYTNKDKFNYLAEKNPNLIELKNKLGLDTDFKLRSGFLLITPRNLQTPIA
jgi:DNA polymerase III subunit gamma/tau